MIDENDIYPDIKLIKDTGIYGFVLSSLCSIMGAGLYVYVDKNLFLNIMVISLCSVFLSIGLMSGGVLINGSIKRNISNSKKQTVINNGERS